MSCFQNFSRWSSFSLQSSVAVLRRDRPQRATEVRRATENKFYFEIIVLLTNLLRTLLVILHPNILRLILLSVVLIFSVVLCGRFQKRQATESHGGVESH